MASIGPNSTVLAAPEADKIAQLPGFGNASNWPFTAYSGFINVPGPFELTEYDSLLIHYQCARRRRCMPRTWLRPSRPLATTRPWTQVSHLSAKPGNGPARHLAPRRAWWQFH